MPTCAACPNSTENLGLSSAFDAPYRVIRQEGTICQQSIGSPVRHNPRGDHWRPAKTFREALSWHQRFSCVGSGLFPRAEPGLQIFGRLGRPFAATAEGPPMKLATGRAATVTDELEGDARRLTNFPPEEFKICGRFEGENSEELQDPMVHCLRRAEEWQGAPIDAGRNLGQVFDSNRHGVSLAGFPRNRLSLAYYDFAFRVKAFQTSADTKIDQWGQSLFRAVWTC